jgi:hypothetical protein
MKLKKASEDDVFRGFPFFVEDQVRAKSGK